LPLPGARESGLERRDPPAPTRIERQEFAGALSRAHGASAGDGARAMVRSERTPLSGDQAAGALSQAWRERFGSPPPARTLSILTAQWAHETGRGRSMLNFNFGGIKGTSPEGLSTSYRTREGSGADEVRIVDEFRAYRSAANGASDYVSLLARRYPRAVEAAHAGDAGGFVRALKSGGYFTGDERAYVKSVTALADQALSTGYESLGAASPGVLASTPGAQPTSESNARHPLRMSHPLESTAHPLLSLMTLVSNAEPSVPSSWGNQIFDAVQRTELLMAALDLELSASQRGNGR
jgi:hypothetical protein